MRKGEYIFHFASFMLTLCVVLWLLLIIRNCLFQNYILSWMLMMTLRKIILQVMMFSSVFKNLLKQARLYFILKGNIQIDDPQLNFMAFIFYKIKWMMFPDPSTFFVCVRESSTFTRTAVHRFSHLILQIPISCEVWDCLDGEFPVQFDCIGLPISSIHLESKRTVNNVNEIVNTVYMTNV